MFPCFNPNCSGPGKREASAIFRSLWYDQFSVWSQVLLTSRLTMQHLRHRSCHITKADRHTFRMEPVTLPENPHLKPSSSPFWRIPLDWLFSLFSMSPRSWSPPSKGEGVFVFFSIGASCPPSCGGTYRREKKHTAVYRSSFELFLKSAILKPFLCKERNPLLACCQESFFYVKMTWFLYCKKKKKTQQSVKTLLHVAGDITKYEVDHRTCG